MDNKKHHVRQWIRDLENSFDEYCLIDDPKDQLIFLSEQYLKLLLINKVLDGSLSFLGFPKIMLEDNLS